MTVISPHRHPAGRGATLALARAVVLPVCLAGALGAAAQPAPPADEPTPDDLAAVLAQPVYGSSRLGAASKRDEDLATAPGAAVVRTGGEIQAQGYRTLGEVLESMPGVHLRYDRAYTYVGLRGITRPGDYTSRLLVLVDGVRANDALYESASMDREFPIDVSLIDRVEFIPGPGSALYGSNAVAGVVNVITRTPSQLAGTQAGVALGSERQRKLTASWGGTLGDARVLLGAATEHRAGGTLHYAEYASPDNPRGTVRGQDGERADKLFAKLQHGGLSLALAVSQRRKEIPTGAYDATFGTAVPWTDSYLTLSAAYTRSLGPDAALDVLLNHSRYGFDSPALYGDDGGLYSRNRNDARWLGGELRWRYGGLAGHRITLGLEGQRNYRQRIELHNLEQGMASQAAFSGSAHRAGLYANDEWTLLPGLQLTLGLRTDRRTDGSAGLSPRVGASWSATPAWTFKWLTGEAYREPNFSELNYEDEVQRRPQGLRVEALRSNELVALWRPAEAWQWQASVHRTRMSRVIELVSEDDGRLAYTNRGGVHAAGADVESSWISPRGMQLRASVGWQRAHDAQTGANLSNAPRRLAKLALTAPLPLLPGLGLGLNAVHVGERRTLAGASVGAYLRLNGRLRWAPPGSPWEGSVTLYNLLDRDYADPAGPEHRQDRLQQDGRSWQLQIGRRF